MAVLAGDPVKLKPSEYNSLGSGRDTPTQDVAVPNVVAPQG